MVSFLTCIMVQALVATPLEHNHIEKIALKSGKTAAIEFTFGRPVESKPRLLYSKNRLTFLFPGISWSGTKPIVPGAPFVSSRAVDNENGTQVQVFLNTPVRTFLRSIHASMDGNKLAYVWRLKKIKSRTAAMSSSIPSGNDIAGGVTVSTASSSGKILKPNSRIEVSSAENADDKKNGRPVGGTAYGDLVSTRPKATNEKAMPGHHHHSDGERKGYKTEMADRPYMNASSGNGLNPKVSGPSRIPAAGVLRGSEYHAGSLGRQTATIYGVLLLFVMIIGGGAFWWSRRNKAHGIERKGIDFLGAKSLGPKQNVVLLRVMGRNLLVGSSDKGLVLLADLGSEVMKHEDEEIKVGAPLDSVTGEEEPGMTKTGQDTENLKIWLQGI
ncbi:MAG: FliO/MopB family protein [Deltaproteobacteria bacterium]|nr:FliO/MopB family protein [Deltaproteobacteria bacterium]